MGVPKVTPDHRSELHFAECMDIEAGGGRVHVDALLASWKKRSLAVSQGVPDDKEPKRYHVKTYEWAVVVEGLLVTGVTLSLRFWYAARETPKRPGRPTEAL